MEKLWENFTTIKEKITQYAEIAKTNEWIGEDEYNNILERVQNDVLTLGVVGQMKSGKSTFLNAFLFKDAVLPVASTPMTAALSVITYGEKEEVIAEFYTDEEWEEIEQKAIYDSDDPDIKAAKELKDKSAVLGDQIGQLLGKTQSAVISELINYVGADGKYTPITKQVTIMKSDKRLKGVRIVDTPGFNDPVVSREERTKKFLVEADAVILLLYAGRPFDKEDKDILFEKIKNVGIGKIIIGVNKYDLAIAEGELETGIKKYVRDAIKKELYEKDNKVLYQLLNNIEPVLLSASMALLAAMPKEKIMEDENLQWHYKKICDDFEVNSQDKLFELSRMENLEQEIDKILSNEKFEILIRKPVYEIQAHINAKKKKFEEETILLTERKKDLSRSDEELAEKLKAFNRAKRKIERMIDSKETDFNEFLKRSFSDTIFNLKKERKSRIDKFHKIINETKKHAEIKRKIESEIHEAKLSLEEKYRTLYDDIKSKFKSITDETLSDLEEIISNTSDEEDWIERRDALFTMCRDELLKFDELSFEDMFTDKNVVDPTKKITFWRVASDVGITILTGLIGLGIKEIIHNRLNHKKFIEDVHKQVDTLFPMDQIEETFTPVREHTDEFISFFRQTFLDELLSPIIDSVESIQTNTINREQEKEKIEKDLLSLKDKKELIEKQLKEVEQYKKTMGL
jgi:hypothetical protein